MELSYLVANPVLLNGDVTHIRLLNGVVEYLDSRGVVDEERRRRIESIAALLKQFTKPFDLSARKARPIELGLSRRSRNHPLKLARPANSPRTDLNDVAISQFTSVRLPGIVRVSLGRE